VQGRNNDSHASKPKGYNACLTLLETAEDPGGAPQSCKTLFHMSVDSMNLYEDTRMKVQLFFTALVSMVCASIGYAQDAATLKNVLTEKFNQIHSHAGFTVEDGAGNFMPEAPQWIARFQTDSTSIYQNYSFSPASGIIEGVTISDTEISFIAKYETVRSYKDGTPTFFLTNGLYARVVCITTSAFDWSCQYQFVDQNYGDRLNPNPIPNISQSTLTTFMGPDKLAFQTKLLEISTATVSELF